MNDRTVLTYATPPAGVERGITFPFYLSWLAVAAIPTLLITAAVRIVPTWQEILQDFNYRPGWWTLCWMNFYALLRGLYAAVWVWCVPVLSPFVLNALPSTKRKRVALAAIAVVLVFLLATVAPSFMAVLDVVHGLEK